MGHFPRVFRVFRRDIAPLALAILVLCSFRSAIADWNVVPTGSMNPSIVEGDRIFVNKLAYGLKVPFTTVHLAHWSAPQRGDVVVFRSPKDGTVLVKRVVALPGDTLSMSNNHLIINGQPATYAALSPDVSSELSPLLRQRSVFASESFGTTPHAVMSTPALHAMRNFGPVTVPTDQYFMLGDNRDNSEDSRYIGFVRRDNILGHAARVIWSVDDHWHPRLERTLQKLP